EPPAGDHGRQHSETCRPRDSRAVRSASEARGQTPACAARGRHASRGSVPARPRRVRRRAGGAAMCWKLVSKLLRDTTITLDPGAKFVLVTIADVTPKGTTTCYVGQETIAKRTGMGERTVRRHIDELVDLGLLKRTRRHTRKGWRDL